MSRRYSHTALKTFQRCAKRWSYRYIDRLEPKEKSLAMQRGIELHDLFAAHYEGARIFAGHPAEDLGLLDRYRRKWDGEDANWTILHVEEEFEMRVGPYTVGFKPDLVIEINGEVWIVDHKTTANIPDEYDPYNMTDFQHLLYVAGLQQLGYNVKGFLFNYIRTKPPAIPKAIKDGSRIADVRRIDTDFATLKGVAEELGMDGHQDVIDRLTILSTTADKFFQRHWLLINEEAVTEAVRDTHRILADMDEAETDGTYPRHVVGKHGGSMSCGRCEFQSICHAELLGMRTDVVLLDYIERPRRTE
jgi:hypothetical protein